MENSMTPSTVYEDFFRASQDATTDSRKESERARDYNNGKQLTAAEISELKKRGQPPTVINRIRRKIEWLKGLEIKQRTDPRAFPRTPQHEKDAESITDAIRFVCDDADWDDVRTDVYDNILVEGFGGAEVVHRQTARGDVEIEINHYPWDRLFYDPYSRKADFSDARYKGVVLWMDQADFDEQFPNAKGHIEGLMAEAKSARVSTETYDDQPNDIWIDAKRNRVRVILIHHRKGAKWHWAKFVGGMVLEEGESPYVDEEGNSECPLLMMSAYIDRDNQRHGVVRDMFDPQDEINKRRSKLLHQGNSRQTMGVKGAVESVSGLKNELAKPDGHVEIALEAFEAAAMVGMKPFEVIGTGDIAATNLGLLQHATQEIDLMGANSALEGETGESASGRAVLAKQQGGMIELAALNDRLHRFTREIYRQVWLRIRQYWTEEKWVRVTDDNHGVKFVGLNRRVTLMEKLSQMPEEQVRAIARQMMLRPNDPRLDMVVDVENNIQMLEVDIILEEVPDQVTLAGEAFQALAKYPNIPPAVLISADPSIPAAKKEELLAMLQQPPQPSPAERLEMAQTEAGVMKTQAEAQKIQAETQMAGMPLAGLA